MKVRVRVRVRVGVGVRVRVRVGVGIGVRVVQQRLPLLLRHAAHLGVEVALVGPHEQAERRAAPGLELLLAAVGVDVRGWVDEVPVDLG